MWKKAQKSLALLLAVLLLASAGVFSPAAFAADDTPAAAPVLTDGAAVIPTNADLSTVKEILCEALVVNADQVDAQALEWEYYCTGKSGFLTNDAWGSIEGFNSTAKHGIITTTYEHSSLSNNGDGVYKVRLAGTLTEWVELTKAKKLPSPITLRQDASVRLVYREDTSVDFDAVRQQIWDNVVVCTDPALTLNDVTIEYYATATTGSAGTLGKAWMPLEGGTKNLLTYPAIPEGTQKIHVSWNGNDTYFESSPETDVTVTDRANVAVTTNEGPYEVGMVFHDDMTYDYNATARAIYNAVVASTDPALTADDVTVEYNADPTSILDVWYPLDQNTLNAFGTGTWEIRFSWSGTPEYKPGSLTAKVTVTDSRLESAVVLKDGASITYNMDAASMKQAIFDNVIDWENASLPAKDTLSVDDFSFEYYGVNVLPGDLSGGVKHWAPIEGGTVALLTYVQMGAGEQQIRVAYKGNADYRPSAAQEGPLTVNKASVKVSVHTASIFADEKPGDGFITTDPADKFDVYTIYGGVTSNVTTSIFVTLPDRYTNSAVLTLLDPVIQQIYGKTFTEMLNDGMTVGELRELLNTQALLDLLDKLNIDTGTFGQILSTLNKLPGIADNVRVAFGTPNQAGIYTVFAVTDNKNYETGVGMGMLIVKMRVAGVKLVWNSAIAGGKLTAEEAAAFDFGVHVEYNGTDVGDSNVHYLYSGMTSNWRIYSSTTTAPTQPGRYVVTVVTLGGNYQAAPITRSFQITK